MFGLFIGSQFANLLLFTANSAIALHIAFINSCNPMYMLVHVKLGTPVCTVDISKQVRVPSPEVVRVLAGCKVVAGLG